MTKQEEFIESFKALMIRYDVEITEDWDDHGKLTFVNDDRSINILIGDIE